MVGMWTMDELVERVRLALADAYPGAPNGRVRDVPDRRAIRWYATTGLVDRPAAMRGRVALYSSRHLLQVVAVKRRQAEGRSLAEIQGELAGASDETLAAAARVPAALLTDAAPAAVADPVADPDQVPARDAIRPRFWATPSAPAPPTAAPMGPTATPGRAADYTRRAEDAPDAAPVAPASATTMSEAGGGGAALAVPVAGVGLRGGVVLLLPAAPGPADYDDIAAAAQPLLDLLAARGLLMPDPDTHADKGSPS